MHCTSASLDKKKYEEVQEELEDIITTLAATFEESVRDRCSTYITQFATGPLDGVKPSLTTLNGLTDKCQKKIKVGVHTELVVCGPSDYWINMCERTLDTIFNNAESMASEGAGFDEIKENVEKMLDYLQSNKNVVFRGSEKACIILFFECNSYNDFLRLLIELDSPGYRVHLKMISEALVRHYRLDTTISISSKVRTYCLQSVLIDVLKMGCFKEDAPRNLRVSSENVDDDTEGLVEQVQGSDVIFRERTESKQPVKLNLECTSKEGLLHIFNSFKAGEFSHHLTSVAEAFSKHYGTNISLKASLDIADVMAAVEEAVSKDIPRRVITTPYNSEEAKPQEEEPIYGHLSDNIYVKASSESERLLKLSPWLREEISYPTAIARHLSEQGLLTSDELYYIYRGVQRQEVFDRLLQMVLQGPTYRYNEFKRAIEIYEGAYTLRRIVDVIAHKQERRAVSEAHIVEDEEDTTGHENKSEFPVSEDNIIRHCENASAVHGQELEQLRFSEAYIIEDEEDTTGYEKEAEFPVSEDNVNRHREHTTLVHEHDLEMFQFSGYNITEHHEHAKAVHEHELEQHRSVKEYIIEDDEVTTGYENETEFRDYETKIEEVKCSNRHVEKKTIIGIPLPLETILYMIADSILRCDLAFK